MNSLQRQNQPENYLIIGKSPSRKSAELYQKDKVLKENFGEVWGAQSHSRRRKLILQKHKQVAELLIPNKPYTIFIAIFVVVTALAITYIVKDQSWPVFLFVCYFVSGTLNHTCHVLIHDFTHNAGSTSPFVNKFMAIFCNIPMMVPTAISFGKFHSDHHSFLGQYGKDPDLPLLIESRNIKTAKGKIFFILMLSLTYSLRPLFCFKKAILTQEYVNLLVIVATDFLIYKYWGINAILYLLIGTYLSIGPHPAAMHVMAQHYQFAKGLQTFDYFGIWNFFNLNLGYHTQHHDFPNCPWYNLPKIRAAAPQFYNYLPIHTSYLSVALKFMFDQNFNLYNRTLRVDKKNV